MCATAHWLSVRFYAYYCAPATLTGFLLGAPLTCQLPHCRAALWLLTHTSHTLTSGWALCGAWLVVHVADAGVWTSGRTQVEEASPADVSVS